MGPTWGRAREGAVDLRRLPEMLRAAPWRTPPELAVQAAFGPSTELAVLLSERFVGVLASFCTMICHVKYACSTAAVYHSLPSPCAWSAARLSVHDRV